jgi:hypothetical protein
MSMADGTSGASASNIDPLLNELLEHREFLVFLTARVSDRAIAEDILQAAYIRNLGERGPDPEDGKRCGLVLSHPPKRETAQTAHNFTQ